MNSRLFFSVLIVFTSLFASAQIRLKKECSPFRIRILIKGNFTDSMQVVVPGSCEGSGTFLFIPKNGEYSHGGLLNRASEGLILTQTKGKIALDGPSVIHFIIEPGTTIISFSMKDSLPEDIVIKGAGSEIEKELFDKKYGSVFDFIDNKYRGELHKLNVSEKDSSETSHEARDKVVARLEAVRDIKGLLALDFVRTHPDSYFSAYLLFKHFYSMDPDSAAEAFTRLSPSVAQSQLGMNAADKILKGSENWHFIKKYADSTFAGKWLRTRNVYDLVSFDTSANEVKFSNFKGKYLFIDFWATWCGPCLKELPNLKEAVANTRDLPVSYVAINVDDVKDRENWKQYVSRLSYPGINVFDGDEFLRSFFHAHLYPTYILIDPEGKIVPMENALDNSESWSSAIRKLIKDRGI